MPKELHIDAPKPMKGKLPIASHSNGLAMPMSVGDSYGPRQVTLSEQNMDIMDGSEKVEAWLRNIAGLPEYSSHFIDHGYDELRIIQEINDEQDLRDIGIMVDEHRKILLFHIQQMQYDNDNTTNCGESERNINIVDDEDTV